MKRRKEVENVNKDEMKEYEMIKEIGDNLSELHRTHNLLTEITSLATPKEKQESKIKKTKHQKTY